MRQRKSKNLGKNYPIYRLRHKQTGEFYCAYGGRLNSLFSKNALGHVLSVGDIGRFIDYELIEYELKEVSTIDVKRMALLKGV